MIHVNELSKEHLVNFLKDFRNRCWDAYTIASKSLGSKVEELESIDKKSPEFKEISANLNHLRDLILITHSMLFFYEKQEEKSHLTQLADTFERQLKKIEYLLKGE